MKIKDHRLHHDDDRPFRFVESPNTDGSKIIPEYLVIHYTAGSKFESAVAHLSTQGTEVSAHLVIGRGGEVAQLVPFDTIAWHAGRSQWDGRFGLNRYSIGIEIDNAGKLKQNANHRWESWFRAEYPNDQVIEATHKHDDTLSGWHAYTQEQLEAATEISRLLVQTYSLKDVVGHDDIAPKRKWDPGPAFPMDSFKSRVLGGRLSEPILFDTTIALTIRSGPGMAYEKLTKKPLPAGTKLYILERKPFWVLVDVVDNVRGAMDMQGWVHASYIKRNDIVLPE
jgi:N-acetylmuramoyl-L-alanine amidase